MRTTRTFFRVGFFALVALLLSLVETPQNAEATSATRRWEHPAIQTLDEIVAQIEAGDDPATIQKRLVHDLRPLVVSLAELDPRDFDSREQPPDSRRQP